MYLYYIVFGIEKKLNNIFVYSDIEMRRNVSQKVYTWIVLHVTLKLFEYVGWKSTSNVCDVQPFVNKMLKKIYMQMF